MSSAAHGTGAGTHTKVDVQSGQFVPGAQAGHACTCSTAQSGRKTQDETLRALQCVGVAATQTAVRGHGAQSAPGGHGGQIALSTRQSARVLQTLKSSDAQA